MSWMTFAVDLLKAAAWPLTVLILGLVYRKPLTGAIHRMTEIQGPGVKALFREKLESVAISVANAEFEPESEPDQIVGESEPESGPRMITEGRRPSMFTGTPLDLIEKSWGKVAKTLSTAVATGLVPDGPVPAILDALVDKKIISEDARDSVLGLNQLLPRALFSRGGVSLDEATDFASLADGISWVLSRDFRVAKMAMLAESAGEKR